jgi:protein TonB
VEGSPPPPERPKSKPPYLFLIPVVLGFVGFIAYQTVLVAMDTPVQRLPYVIDTSVAQAVVRDGVITVHPHHAPVPQRVAVATKKPKATALPSASPLPSPSVAPSASTTTVATQPPAPEPTAIATGPTVATVVLSHPRKPRDDDAISTQPVPHIRRRLVPRTVAYASGAPNRQTATTPPITDVPSIRTNANAAARAATTKAAQVAQVPGQTPSGPIDASDRVVDAKMSYAAAPEYPDLAREQGAHGTSVVYVTVDPNGSILHLLIASSSGNDALDRAALSAARNSRYVPPTVDGKPATETYRITYDFTP